ncbi:MAG: EamA family transporter [Planctomycetia bacterium]|nr:EamA family transporter [Planctomycetia bacterium]
MWFLYAICSAFFAALTAIFAKIGIQGVDSNLATAIRTVVILLLAWTIVLFSGTFRQIPSLPHKTWTFLVLSGLATGASWLFYFKAMQMGDVSRVAPVDKFSIVLTIILAFVVLQEVPTTKSILGGILISLGVLIMAL